MIHEVQTSKKVIAITFDDGPNPVYTPLLLDIFQEVSGKATFFMIGKHMEKYPDIVKLIIDQQHEIGNHTYTHPNLSELKKEDCLEEILETDRIIEEMTGAKTTIFRPPYLQYNDVSKSIITDMQYKVIGACNLESKDWEQPGVEHIYKTSRMLLKNGQIFLFHEGFGDRSQTIEAVKRLVHECKEQGYELLTVSELLKLK